MPDITMCADAQDCSRKMFCYRSVAVPSERQSWADFFDECEKENYINFMEVKKRGF